MHLKVCFNEFGGASLELSDVRVRGVLAEVSLRFFVFVKMLIFERLFLGILIKKFTNPSKWRRRIWEGAGAFFGQETDFCLLFFVERGAF